MDGGGLRRKPTLNEFAIIEKWKTITAYCSQKVCTHTICMVTTYTHTQLLTHVLLF